MAQIQHDKHRARRVPDDAGGGQIRRRDFRSGHPSGALLWWGGTDGRRPADVGGLPTLRYAEVGGVHGLACLRRPNELWLAACRLINLQLAHPGLDALFIADRLGCSRATLYRAFADRDLAVAGYIREQRLQRVWFLLHNLPASVPIAEMARRCGFLDSTSFSRLFRRRFGVRARDVRAGG